VRRFTGQSAVAPLRPTFFREESPVSETQTREGEHSG